MSTRFFRARFADGTHTLLYDTDSPLALFEELAAGDRLTKDWAIDLLDYRGELLVANYPLGLVQLSMSAERLLKLVSRA
jgi:hypothetical protein